MSLNVNVVVVAGRLGKDAVVRKAGAGTLAEFSLAVAECSKNETGEFSERTHWVQVCAWNNLAKTYGERLKKGAQVLVEGSLQFDSWEKDGQKRSVLRVRARALRIVDGPKASAVAGEADRGPQGQGDDEDLPF